METKPFKIIGVRHAETTANIGEHFEDQASIDLSLNGIAQANELSKKLETPDLILLSKFKRTQDTAAPFIALNPNVPVAVSTLTHEFHYLSSDRFIENKDPKLRASLRESYWSNMDPYYKDEHGRDDSVESFADFAIRVHEFLLYLGDLKDDDNLHILVFTHGLFLRMVYLLTNQFSNLFNKGGEGVVEAMKELMNRFRDARNDIVIDNISVHDLSESVDRYLSIYKLNKTKT